MKADAFDTDRVGGALLRDEAVVDVDVARPRLPPPAARFCCTILAFILVQRRSKTVKLESLTH